MRKCSFCGTEASDNAKYCRECGRQMQLDKNAEEGKKTLWNSIAGISIRNNFEISLVLAAIISLIIFGLIAVFTSEHKTDDSENTPQISYTRSVSSSNRAKYSAPPVSNEALTSEEAEKLYGTGYNGTRPNSTAESIEIKATQNKCRECGKHTTHGVNSLCDSCLMKAKYK